MPPRKRAEPWTGDRVFAVWRHNETQPVQGSPAFALSDAGIDCLLGWLQDNEWNIRTDIKRGGFLNIYKYRGFEPIELVISELRAAKGIIEPIPDIAERMRLSDLCNYKACNHREVRPKMAAYTQLYLDISAPMEDRNARKRRRGTGKRKVYVQQELPYISCDGGGPAEHSPPD